MSSEDIKKFIRPIESIVAYEANHIDNLSIVMKKLDIVRLNAWIILEMAKNTYTDDDWDVNKSIFVILEWSFWKNISDWSPIWRQSLIVKQFIDRILPNIKDWSSENNTHAANDIQLKIMA